MESIPKTEQPSSSFLKTDSGKTKSNTIEIPSIPLPKGGDAIKGIDQKFSINAVNGTASFSIPLPFVAAGGASSALIFSFNSGTLRTDTYCECKGGLEIRTTCFCKKVLLFHPIRNPDENDGMVRSLNFQKDFTTHIDFTCLKSSTAFGYIKKATSSCV